MDCATISQCDSYDGSLDFCNIDKVKARKIQRCGECRRLIFPGETYERVSGKWDGEFVTEKTCSDCLSIRSELFQTYFYGGIKEGLHEMISEADGDVNQACIARMTPAGRAMVCQMIEDYWADIEDDDED